MSTAATQAHYINCMDEDTDNSYKLYGGGSYTRELSTSFVDPNNGDRAYFGIKTPSNSGSDPTDWDWLMFVPYTATDTKGVGYACMFTPAAVTAYSGKGFVGFITMHLENVFGYMIHGNPYGSAGKIDLSSIVVSGRDFYGGWIPSLGAFEFGQNNDMQMVARSGNVVDLFYVYDNVNRYYGHLSKNQIDFSTGTVTRF